MNQTPETFTATGTIVSVPLSLIEITGANDRTVFDDEDVIALAASIESLGLIQPITLRRINGENRFEIVAGERRYRAHVHNGADTIPAVIENLDNDSALDRMLAENTGRVDLNPIEEAAAFQRRIDQGHTVERVAKVAGVTAHYVETRASLTTLEPEVQAVIASGWLGTRNAHKMVGLDPLRQRMALRAIAKDLTQAQVITVIVQLQNQQATEPMFEMATEEYVIDAGIAAARAAAKAAVPVRGNLVDMLRAAAKVMGDAGLAADLVAEIEAIDR